MKSLPYPKAVLFDWDDTLVSTRLANHAAYNHTLKAYGMPEIDLEVYCRLPSRASRDSFPEIFKEHAVEAEKLFYNYMDTAHLHTLKPFEKAQTTLEYLKKKGVYVAVVSNKLGTSLRKEVTHLGWDAYFSLVIGSRDTPYDKPSVVPAQEALKQSPHQPSDGFVWFVGDSIIDILCAKASGCFPVLMGASQTSEPDTFPMENHEQLLLTLQRLSLS